MPPAKVHDEVRFLLDELISKSGRPVDVTTHTALAVSNVICSVVYGSRFDYFDPIFVENVDALRQSTRHQTLIGLVNFLPALEFLPRLLPRDRMLQRNVRMREELAREQLAAHRKDVDAGSGSSPRDFIDAYLARLTELRRLGKSTTFDGIRRHIVLSVCRRCFSNF